MKSGKGQPFPLIRRLEKGKIEGTEEAIKRVAKNLLMIGTDDAVILQVTGLSREELERIKAE